MKTGAGKVNNFRKGGRYLYADYTPLEQNIDFLSQLKDFIDISDIIFQAHNDFEHLRAVLAEAESLESEFVSNSLSIRSTEIEFWNQRRKVSDFGLKDIMIPVGLKTPITKRLKKSLDFLPGLDKEGKSQRAPKFVNVEDYYLYSANTDGKENLLVVLVDSPSKPDDNLIQIKYRISELNHHDGRTTTTTNAAADTSAEPKTHYLEYNKLPR